MPSSKENYKETDEHERFNTASQHSKYITGT